MKKMESIIEQMTENAEKYVVCYLHIMFSVCAIDGECDSSDQQKALDRGVHWGRAETTKWALARAGPTIFIPIFWCAIFRPNKSS